MANIENDSGEMYETLESVPTPHTSRSVSHRAETASTFGKAISYVAQSLCGVQCLERVFATKIQVQDKQFILLHKLAEGGYSFVYTAEEISTRQQYAAKLILCQSSEQFESSRWEMGVHASFDHPNILSVLYRDFVQLQDDHVQHAVLIFPLYRSGTCQDILDRQRKLNRYFREVDCIRLVKGIAMALHEFHSHSPVWSHRDLKPHNVLLSDSGEAVLMDFGSTTDAIVPIRSSQDATQLQEIAEKHSSMAYRAPELYQPEIGSVVTEKTDMWALGCVMYALAFGYSPFEVAWGPNGEPRVVDVTHLRVIGRWQFPPHASSFSEIYRTQIEKLLQHDPTQRPSAQDIVQCMTQLSHHVRASAART